MVRNLYWRVYRARPLASLILCLPGLLILAWYGFNAFANVDRYHRFVNEEKPLSLETLQIALHDALVTDQRRMVMPPPPEDSALPTFRLLLTRSKWNQLLRSASKRDDRPYVRAKVEELDSGTLKPARVRLRGGRHWHLGETQKSMKVKMDKGELLAGSRVGNFINDPTPMVIGEQLIIDLAKEQGILTPASYFARLKVNSKDLGVYHYEAGADESLLRAAQRMPGSIFDGELSKKTPTSALWASPEHWTKVASRTDSEEDKNDFSELEAFLAHFREDTALAFRNFAEHELDLDKFARMDVLDVAFGGDQHDFRENHKYYFDPYRGRWEPIAWNFRGFHADPHFNLVDNPVLLRLKSLPTYLSLRDRLLYQFLTTDGTPSRIRERAEKQLKVLAPELLTDRYWDAYRQLPRVDAFHRRMVRPMNLERLLLVVESELTTYTHRHEQLIGELERNPLFLHASPVARRQSTPDTETSAEASAQFELPFSLVVNGRAGAELRELSVDLPKDCTKPEARLLRARETTKPGSEEWSPVLTRNVRGQMELVEPLTLVPGVSVIAHERPNPRRGTVRSSPNPLTYRFKVTAQCEPRGISAEARHLATDSRIISQPINDEALQNAAKVKALAATEVPRFAVGEVFPHPWEYPVVQQEKIVLGPGTVDVKETRVFTAKQAVEVEPGTHLAMGPGASLIFLGPVNFRGRANAKITINASGTEAWGGLALQGPGVSGAKLRYVVAQGGTTPAWQSIPYPALLNIHDTDNIRIEDCSFSDYAGETDVIHAAYVRHLKVFDTVVERVGGDALDLEFSQGELKRLKLSNVGDDGVDTMGSTVSVNDSVLVALAGNGISAGEESEIDVRNTVIASAKVGALAKNASSISLSGSVLLNNRTGVKSYKRTVRYAGDSHLFANELFVVGSKKHALKRSDRKGDRLDSGRILQALPQPGVLDHVLHNVLELRDWQALNKKLAQLQGDVGR